MYRVLQGFEMSIQYSKVFSKIQITASTVPLVLDADRDKNNSPRLNSMLTC